MHVLVHRDNDYDGITNEVLPSEWMLGNLDTVGSRIGISGVFQDPFSLPSLSPMGLSYKMAAEGQDVQDRVRGRRKSGALGEISA